MPAAAPPDVASFLACLRQSGLVSKAKLAKFLEGRGASTAKDVASDLVAAKLLTRWQAEKILAGRCRGFRLGSYALLGLLGRGGMSAVYLGEHVVMKRRCAIKVLPAKLVGGGSHLERFMREARAVAALDHPNIVRAYDVASEGEGMAATHFLVMELVEGRSLYDLVKRDGPPPADRVREIGHEAAKGLAHAHAAGIVHRDVKPGNILLASTGVVKVTDLGLARGTEDEEHSLTVAHDEKVLGTADYLAPEQALDSHAVDHRADIYGLGCTLYFSLCGHGPFTEGTLTQRLMAHQTQPPPPIESLVEGVPPDLAGAVARMLEKRPEDRFQSMDEVADALAAPGSQIAQRPAAQEPPPEPELNDFLAGLPAEPGSESSAGSRSGIRLRAATRSRTGARGAAGARPGGPSGSDLSPQPSSVTPPPSSGADGGAEPTPSPGSGRFDFLGGADVADGGSDGPGSAASGVGSGSPVQPGSGTDAASGVRGGPGSEPDSEPGSGANAGSAAGRSAPASSGNPPPLPAADPSPPPRSRKKGAAEAVPPKPKWPWIAAGVLTLLAAIGLGVWLTGGDGAGEEGAVVEGHDGKVATEGAEEGAGTDAGPLTVGPDGRFPTLAAAIVFLKEKHGRVSSPGEKVVELPPGTISERLMIDGGDFLFPENVTIRGAAAGTTFKTDGGEPAITLFGPLDRFKLENVAVDAAGKAVAVELVGAFNDSTLSRLAVANLTGTGLRLNNLPSGNLRIEGLAVTAAGGAAGAEAIGVRLTGGVRGPILAGGAISGTSVGVEVASNAEDLTLRGLKIGPGTVGVQFGGPQTRDLLLKNVTLKDLTFFELRRGIAFETPPKGGDQPWNRSKDLVIAGCEFNDVGEPVGPTKHTNPIRSALNAAESQGNAAQNAEPDPFDLFP